jgi:hypothetical protein
VSPNRRARRWPLGLGRWARSAQGRRAEGTRLSEEDRAPRGTGEASAPPAAAASVLPRFQGYPLPADARARDERRRALWVSAFVGCYWFLLGLWAIFNSTNVGGF